MEYERIDKPQTGFISPSKLRAKLMGLSPQKRKEGSNGNSSRTSPPRLEDSEFVKNSLLASNNDNLYDSAAVSLEPPQKLGSETASDSVENHKHFPPRESSCRGDNGNNSSAVHPLKLSEDENLDYDSNASSSSFEFHKAERAAQRSLTRSLSRPTSYKWNDAEKWIMSKQTHQSNNPKSLGTQNGNGGTRTTGLNMVRVAPDNGNRVPEMKRVDFCQPITGQMSLDKFTPTQPNVSSVTVDLYPHSKDLAEVGNMNNSAHEAPGTPGIRAISMRDMGTEMTPVPSQEPSRTATPNESTTPLRSPTSSIPSTPRTEEPNTTIPADHDAVDNNPTQKGNKELSEQEMKEKTRKEIVALGVQLGKMNIAAWASKDDKVKSPSSPTAHSQELGHVEFEKRAAAWEEAEKSKHAARFKREEIKIQAWESNQKAKLEEDLRKIEAKVERLRTSSQSKMMKKIAMAKKRSEQKRRAAEAQKKRQAEKTAAQAEYIRQTGRNPPSDYICCGLLK
ncbi:Remorin 4.1 [Bienertia sinuspersici]